MNIYQITDNILNGINKFIDEDGVLDEIGFKKWISGNEQEFDSKVLGTGAYIKNILLEIESIKKVENDLQERRNKKEKWVEKLKSGLLYCMTSLNKDKVSGIEIDVSWKFNPPSVFADESLVPASYTIEKISRSIDKITIAKDLKLGIEIPGCSLIQKKSIIIK